MSRPGLSHATPNGRIAWLIAGAAVALILTLPPAAEAQNDRPYRQAGPAQKNGTGNGSVGGSRGSQFDIFDYRDVIMNTMVVAPAPGAAQPFTSSEIVCLAGCDRGAGSVVYRDQPVPTLAKLSDPVLSTNAAPREVVAAASQLSCIAGCYEPPKVRTVASLRQMQTAPAPVRVASRSKPATVTEAPTVAALDRPAPSDGPDPSLRLRSAFSGPDATPSVRRLSSQARTRGTSKAKASVKRGHDYGKVVPVPRPAPQVAKVIPVPTVEEPKTQPILRDQPQASADRPAPAPSDTPSNTPVTRFSATNRPTPEPATTVRNDWFNTINRERKAKDAAQKEPANIVDATAD